MLQPSDEIKSKLDIVDVIRDYIPLKATGVNFRAKCPFHRENTPSFIVSPEKQIWHCFGCGKGGDIFSFIMEIEGVSFAESLRILAPKAGVILRKQNPKITSQRNRLLDIIEASVNYYHDILLENPQAEVSRNYLAERKITPETISSWQIGYAPESWDDLINHLKGRGFSDNEIFLAGMSIKKEGSNRFYNRFRDRIMFPIFDINGNAVAFSGRVNPAKEAEEKTGKYINSPATMIYDKSNILFGLDRAKMEIKAQDLAIVVEGQMDVIMAHQNGFKNVIASSGTALTKEQVKLIKRYTNNIALAFDMDQAGQIAAERGIREAMAEEMNIKVITLPQGKDPDECIKNNPEEWTGAVINAQPMMEYYLDRVMKEFNIEDISEKKEAIKKLSDLINNFKSNIEKDYWIKKLADKFDIREDILRETIIQNKKEQKNYNYNQEESIKDDNNFDQKNITREEKVSENLLALVFKFPNLIEYISNHINIDCFFGAHNKFLYKNLLIYYNNIINKKELASFDYQDFRSWLNKTQEENEDMSFLLSLDRLVILADRDFYEFDNEKARSEVIKSINFLKKYYLWTRMKEIEKLIAELEKQDEANEEIDNLMQELKSLSEEMSKLE